MPWPDCQLPVQLPILDPLDSIGVAVNHVMVLIGVTTPWYYHVIVSIGVATPWYYHAIVSIGVTTPWLGAAAAWYCQMMVV
jgi:hypothetical protein